MEEFKIIYEGSVILFGTLPNELFPRTFVNLLTFFQIRVGETILQNSTSDYLYSSLYCLYSMIKKFSCS